MVKCDATEREREREKERVKRKTMGESKKERE
jgi:hypothetical protein